MRSKKDITRTFTFEGQRHYVSGKSEKEVISKIAVMKHELEEGKKILNPKSLTVKEWADICMADYKQGLSSLTITGYRSKMNKWVLSEIGSLRLKDVKPLHCQKIMNGMNGYAKDTISKVYQMMNFIFDKAVQNRLIYENPAQHLTIPKGTKSGRRAITNQERKYVLQVCDTDRKYSYFLFMLMCGCRPSEVAEIKGFDITKVEGANMLHIRGTKTEKADRYVPVPDYLMERIPEAGKFDYLFTNAKGNKMSEGNRNGFWKHFRRDLNIAMGCKVYRNELIPPFPVADDFTPYCLRHTYCTDLQKKGIDIRTAQYLMGHDCDQRICSEVRRKSGRIQAGRLYQT